MKPLTRKDMYVKDKDDKIKCILPVGALPKSLGRSKYDPATEDKKHRKV